MMHPDSNLEDVEEAIEQNERIKSLLVGQFRYVENIRFDGLQSVVRIFNDPVWTDVDVKTVRHLQATCLDRKSVV